MRLPLLSSSFALVLPAEGGSPLGASSPYLGSSPPRTVYARTEKTGQVSLLGLNEGGGEGRRRGESFCERDLDRNGMYFPFYFFHVACRILVHQPGIEPAPPVVKAWGPNHWTAREVSEMGFIASLLTHALSSQIPLVQATFQRPGRGTGDMRSSDSKLGRQVRAY